WRETYPTCCELMNILAELRSRFRLALVELESSAGRLAELVLPSQDPKIGDYQANCAMRLAKRLAKPPREIAQQIVAQVDLADMCHTPQIAGPGFINVRLKDEFLLGELRSMLADEQHLGVQPLAEPKTIVL